MKEFYPLYTKLCDEHSKALSERNILKIKETEAIINDFKSKFFNV